VKDDNDNKANLLPSLVKNVYFVCWKTEFIHSWLFPKLFLIPITKLTIYAAINKHLFMAENNPAQLKT